MGNLNMKFPYGFSQVSDLWKLLFSSSAIKTSRHNVRQSSYNVYKLSTQHHTELNTHMIKSDHMYLYQDTTQLNYTDNEIKVCIVAL